MYIYNPEVSELLTTLLPYYINSRPQTYFYATSKIRYSMKITMLNFAR